MNRRPSPAVRNLLLGVAAVAAAGCAGIQPPETPDYLKPPAGQSAYLMTKGSGHYLYECRATPGAPKGHAWQFKSTEATLTDAAGKTVGTIGAGPTWTAADGSRFTGEPQARKRVDNDSAVPWLLIGAKNNAGDGVFGQTKSVQRVDTQGGLFPSTPCTRKQVGTIGRVPYAATYYYYR